MAVTDMGGVLVGTALTLLYLPSLYALWFRRSLGVSDDTSQCTWRLRDVVTIIFARL